MSCYRLLEIIMANFIGFLKLFIELIVIFKYFKHGLINLSTDLSFNHERLERQFKLVFQEGFQTQIAFYSSFFLCFEIVEEY